ncbi:MULTISPECIES: hypothetical protein [Corallococcus]|uniref:hypothetical protein n=1 Tax=Corallococcus TaxID=83461 RepID=UPI0011802DA9|nr:MULTISPECIES: hypothetical protein [Corallococcus]NBD07620.1 hypothetical protein [Corallococcus silvisoli]TSC33622.1 hypothetical protein FOF48_00780 [Corallococcus sp. Z5C101001]
MKTRHARRRRSRGQSLVLACLSFLLLALMTTLSFNLSHALREKMNLQQHSDTMAYSMAVLEARSLNYYAVTNRAIAASYAAMTSVHGYMVAASVTGDMMTAGAWNFGIIAVEELGQCYPNLSHCAHAIEAGIIAGKYSQKANNYNNKVKNLERPFNQVIKELNGMADALHGSQATVHTTTRNTLRGSGLSALTDNNAPGASNVSAGVGGLNILEFDCVVDGMNCQKAPSTDIKARARSMTEVSNATRPGWASDRSIPVLMNGIPTYLNNTFQKSLLKDIPSRGTHMGVTHAGTAKVVESMSGIHANGQTSGNTGKMVGADEHGILMQQWRDGFSAFPYKATLSSAQSGSEHKPNGAHNGQHSDFRGINTKDLSGCASTGNCFMKFRGIADPGEDWGQPHVYSYVTKQFFIGGGTKGPWELNSSGTMRFNHGAQGEGELRLAPGEGAALSKALVYYHRLGKGGWKEAPSLFNPYWRAKLHPFTAQEATKVLGAAGNSEAGQIAAGAEKLTL